MYLGPETLTYRTTQLIKGNGCCVAYLRRIGAEYSKECVEGGARVESTQHILSDCPAYESQRIVLKNDVDGNLTLHVLTSALTVTENDRRAVITFYEYMMKEKERNENERKRLSGKKERRLRKRNFRRARHNMDSGMTTVLECCRLW